MLTDRMIAVGRRSGSPPSAVSQEVPVVRRWSFVRGLLQQG